MARRRLYKLISIAAAATLIIVLPILSFTGLRLPSSSSLNSESTVICPPSSRLATGRESYDNATSLYTIDDPMINWDRKRSHWFKLHPTFSPSENRVLVVTGSQSSPCKNPAGDNFLLRSFKNKVDYSRIHGYSVYYNNAYFHPKMRSYWAKIPVLRAAMVAHPEVEWLFWIDADAIFTDMEFKIPLERYKDYNMVVNGWPDLLANRSWVAVNAGVYLIRNCQWSMELLEVWAGMGPKSPKYKKWGKVLRWTFKDKMFPESDDQSALIYQMVRGKRKWRERIYVENEYSLHGYWMWLMGKLDVDKVRGMMVERPFVTHFTGCRPCSGDHSSKYGGEECRVGMETALNYADNQVLRNYGFVRPDLRISDLLCPLPL